MKNGFAVEAMAQTRGATTLERWKTGDPVNLERALKFGDRVGGHFILGHVDEVAKLIGIRGNNYKFQVSQQNAKYMVPKGSIAVDGVSLTITDITRNFVSVALIPYTLKNTTLERLKKGSFVNIEYDYLVKSVKDHAVGK
jgi:riboflavin synthase